MLEICHNRPLSAFAISKLRSPLPSLGGGSGIWRREKVKQFPDEKGNCLCDFRE